MHAADITCDVKVSLWRQFAFDLQTVQRLIVVEMQTRAPTS